MLLKAHSAEQQLWGISLIIAPLLLALSTFFWVQGEYGVTGGTIMVFSLIFWIPALIALFGLVKNKMPVYASIGLLVAIYGCIAGVNFGFVGVYSSIFDISHQTYIQQFSKYPLSSNLLLFWGGPLMPLSILVLGIMLIRTKSIHWLPALLLCLWAVAFPVSRIPRIQWIAHVADLLVLLPMIYLGIRFLGKHKSMPA